MTRIRSAVCVLVLCGCDSLLGVHDIVPVDAPPDAYNPASALTFAVTDLGALPANQFQILDINADGKPDLFADTQFFINTTAAGAAPAFTPSPFSLVPGFLAEFVDLNADGEPDLLDFNNPDTINVFPDATPVGSSAVAFGAKATVTGGVAKLGDYVGIVFGDVDGDGKPDILEFHTPSTLSVFVNTTTPGAASTFASHVDLSSGVTGMQTPELHDLNGDGKLDIMEMQLVDQATAFTNPAILLNTSHPGAPSFQLIGGVSALTGCNQFAFADLDGDGFADIVAICGQSVTVLRNTTTAAGSAPTFAAPVVLFSKEVFAYGLLLTDLDLDGKPDLVVVKPGDAAVSKPTFCVSINTGAVGAISFSDPLAVALEPDGALIGVDINGDGRNEIVTTVEGSNSIDLVIVTVSGPSP